MSDFVKIEVDYLKTNCNFTEEEEKVFDFKCRDYSDVYIYTTLCISDSTLTRLIQKIKTKIIKVAIS